MQIPQREKRFGALELRDKKTLTAIIFVFACFFVYAIVLLENTCFVAGGSDSSGYLSTARSLSRGHIVQDVPELSELQLSDDWLPVFMPLAYVAGPSQHTMAPLVTPGVPLHMALAARIGGWARSPFLVSPILALLSLILVYALAREFGLSSLSALSASLILALCPAFMTYGMQPMSDVIATFWILLTLLLCLRSKKNARIATAAGAAFGIAVLVRPTNILLLAALLFALPLKAKQLLLFVAGGLPCAVLFLIYNSIAYGHATQTGYGAVGGMLAWSTFPKQFAFYSYQLLWQLSPLIPLAWLALTVRRRVALRQRLILFVWPAAFLLFYSFNGPFDAWWYVRYLLPAVPGIILGALVFWEDVAQSRRKVGPRALAAIGVTLVLVIAATEVYQVAHYDVLENHKAEDRYVEASGLAARSFPERALVLSMQMSGSLRYYTSLRVARWDMLDNEKMDLLRKRAQEKGERLYAVLFPFEVEEVKRRVHGQWTGAGVSHDITLWTIDSIPASGVVSAK
jgi:Dolichyl-phosphate-mannose-protein mannosyltransferase